MTRQDRRGRPSPRLYVAAWAVAALCAAALLGGTGESEAQSSMMLGVDVKPGLNSPSAIEIVDTCTSVDEGDDFTIDVFINNVHQLRSWELRVAFDEDVVTLEDVDFDQFLLSSPPGGNVFPTLFERESPGQFFLAAAEAYGPADSGDGVLARLAMKAADEGDTTIKVVASPKVLGPRLVGLSGDYLGDSSGDGVWDGSVIAGEILVGEGCDEDSPVITPKPTTRPRPTRTPAPGSGGGGDDPDGSSGQTTARPIVGVQETPVPGGNDPGSSDDGDQGNGEDTGAGTGAEPGGDGRDNGPGESSARGAGSSSGDSTWVFLVLGAALGIVTVGGGMLLFLRRGD